MIKRSLTPKQQRDTEPMIRTVSDERAYEAGYWFDPNAADQGPAPPQPAGTCVKRKMARRPRVRGRSCTCGERDGLFRSGLEQGWR